MNKKYHIRYFPLFYKDLEQIMNYIIYKLNNVIAANNLIDKIEYEIKKRASNPENYEKYKTCKNRKNTYYKLYINNYIVFYTIKDDIMEVRRILYSRRNFDKLIK